jgi:phosphatidylserine decarboxylase
MMFVDYIKTFPQFIIPKHGLTSFAGFLANVKTESIKNHLIKNFIKKYRVNMQEALVEDPEAYACFNDFFIRHLKPDARPIAKSDIICPVDGFISEIGTIDAGKILQAKKKFYSVEQLLARDSLSSDFSNGAFATLYLSPRDYHRVHMPIDASVIKMIYIPGRLFSVQPTTARTVSQLFARNERLVVFFKTQVGCMAMVLVGATIVGGIGTSWGGDVKRNFRSTIYNYEQNNTSILQKKEEEMGYFKLGSTVILLFSNQQKMHWEQTLKAGDAIRFGQALGHFRL